MARKTDITIRILGDASNFNKTVGKTETGLQRFNKFALGASAAVAAGAVAIGKDMVGVSQEITKMDKKAGAVFEDQIGTINKWADSNKEAFGLSRRETVGLAANFADLLKPMGFTAKQATNMSQEVLGLSGALSNWSGGQYDAAQVSEILSKAMLGEREQLKSLGISISEADVTARLAAKGQNELTGEALAQAKAIATQELIMEKSTDAQKAWADGGREAAEAQNASRVAFQEGREALATLLTPAIKAGTEAVAALSKLMLENKSTVLAVGAAVGGLAATVLVVNGTYKAYQAITKAVIIVTKAWTVAQKALNWAFKSHPIGLVITAIALLVAGIVTAYKKSETFRNIVQGAMRGVQAAFGLVIDRAKDLWNFLSGLPGKIKSKFASIGNAISAPFKAGWNLIKSGWNSTLGGKGFSVTIPDWVPKWGGNNYGFHLPYFHQGGVFDSGQGEGIAMLRDGEGIFTPEQMSAMGGGDIHVEVLLSPKRIEGIAEVVVKRNNRELKRTVLAGAI